MGARGPVQAGHLALHMDAGPAPELHSKLCRQWKEGRKYPTESEAG